MYQLLDLECPSHSTKFLNQSVKTNCKGTAMTLKLFGKCKCRELSLVLSTVPELPG